MKLRADIKGLRYYITDTHLQTHTLLHINWFSIGLIVHFGALLLNIISCILYVAEAIYIDRLLQSADDEEFILGCFNQTWVNITQPS